MVKVNYLNNHQWTEDGYTEYDRYLYPMIKCSKCNLRIMLEEIDDKRIPKCKGEIVDEVKLK